MSLLLYPEPLAKPPNITPTARVQHLVEEVSSTDRCTEIYTKAAVASQGAHLHSFSTFNSSEQAGSRLELPAEQLFMCHAVVTGLIPGSVPLANCSSRFHRVGVP